MAMFHCPSAVRAFYPRYTCLPPASDEHLYRATNILCWGHLIFRRNFFNSQQQLVKCPRSAHFFPFPAFYIDFWFPPSFSFSFLCPSVPPFSCIPVPVAVYLARCHAQSLSVTTSRFSWWLSWRPPVTSGSCHWGQRLTRFPSRKSVKCLRCCQVGPLQVFSHFCPQPDGWLWGK